MAASKNPGTSGSITILDSCVPLVTTGSLAYANQCKLLSGGAKLKSREPSTQDPENLKAQLQTMCAALTGSWKA